MKSKINTNTKMFQIIYKLYKLKEFSKLNEIKFFEEYKNINKNVEFYNFMYYMSLIIFTNSSLYVYFNYPLKKNKINFLIELIILITPILAIISYFINIYYIFNSKKFYNYSILYNPINIASSNLLLNYNNSENQIIEQLNIIEEKFLSISHKINEYYPIHYTDLSPLYLSDIDKNRNNNEKNAQEWINNNL